jgi:hypothetical protein
MMLRPHLDTAGGIEVDPGRSPTFTLDTGAAVTVL